MHIFTEPRSVVARWLPILRRKGCSVLFYSYINHGYKDAYYQEVLGIPKGVNQHIYYDGWVAIDLEEAESFASTFARHLESPTYISYFRIKCRNAADELLDFGRSVRDREYASLSNAELLSAFSTFSSLSIRAMPFLTTIVQMQDVLERRILLSLEAGGVIGGVGAEAAAAELQRLVASGHDAPLATLSIQRLRDLAKTVVAHHPQLAKQLSSTADFSTIASSLFSDYPSLKSAFTEYLREFDFLGTDYYVGNPLSLADVLDKVAALIRDIGYESPLNGYVGADAGYLDAETQALVEAAQDLNYLRQHRIEALFKAGRDARSMLVEIGSRLGLTYDELLALQFLEIYGALQSDVGGISLSVIAERLREYAVLIEDGTASIVTGAALLEVRQKLSLAETLSGAIVGTTAVIGQAEGRARVITTLEDVRAMQPGEVLVAPMTSPYHVPAMTIASAIVTDEGGILSHAAIIARELGVPCVVGTKNATQRINTGARIRVNALATAGSVEILEESLR